MVSCLTKTSLVSRLTTFSFIPGLLITEFCSVLLLVAMIPGMGAAEVGVADSGYQEQGKDYFIMAALNTGN